MAYYLVTKENKPTDFFMRSVVDSVFADADEILPLVAIDKQSDMVTWNESGYTYDWADNGTEYGLSEFLILSGSAVEIECTLTTANFLLY